MKRYIHRSIGTSVEVGSCPPSRSSWSSVSNWPMSPHELPQKMLGPRMWYQGPSLESGSSSTKQTLKPPVMMAWMSRKL